MQRTEIGETHGKIPIRLWRAVKNQTMPRTIHWFQAISSFFLGRLLLSPALHHKHVFHVILPVSTCLPQVLFVNNGCHDFLVSISSVFASKKILQFANNACAVRKHKYRARAARVDHEERLCLADRAVISVSKCWYLRKIPGLNTLRSDIL